MKEKLFFCIVLAFIPFYSFGQRFYPGFKAGLGGAFFKNSDVKDEYNFSYSMGIFTNSPVTRNKQVSLQAEMLFASKGGSSYLVFSDVRPYPIANKSLSYELYYVDIPLMVKVSSRETNTQLYAQLEEPYRVYAMAGMVPSFFLKGRSRFDIYNGSPVTNAKKFDFGVVGSLGIEYRIGRHTLLFAEGRATNGLLTVFKDTSVKNFTYALMSGIRF